MALEVYMAQIRAALERLEKEQAGNIRKAAAAMTDAVENGKSLFSFGASHSFMITQELVYRTGGLMLINPIFPKGMSFDVRPLTATSQTERIPGLGATLLDDSPAQTGDVLLITSTSGRNAVVIDMAFRAKERGMTVIGITALAYTHGVASRHASGKKLIDACDIVIDNAAPYGDATVALPGFPQKTGPLSSVTGCVIANALTTEIVAEMLRRNLQPPVFLSANLDGGDATNAEQLARYASRIHYL